MTINHFEVQIYSKMSTVCSQCLLAHEEYVKLSTALVASVLWNNAVGAPPSIFEPLRNLYFAGFSRDFCSQSIPWHRPTKWYCEGPNADTLEDESHSDPQSRHTGRPQARGGKTLSTPACVPNTARLTNTVSVPSRRQSQAGS